MRKLTEEEVIEIVDYWLLKAYGIHLMDIPEEIRKSHKFYETYPVSEALHDDWMQWAFEYCKEKTKYRVFELKQGFSWLYLDLAPMIKIDEPKRDS